MKVGHTTEIASTELARRADESVSRVQPAGRVEGESPQVSITQAEKLNQTNTSDSEVRTDLVERVKAAIDDSSFKIDPSVVANRMIHETASLLELLTGESTPAAQANGASEPIVQNSQEKFGAGPANERKPGPDR
jgi:anti-sigma28 factor (negative regulator of flagellin synthesis)